MITTPRASLKRCWYDLDAEFETRDEVVVGVTYYADRDPSSGEWSLMAVDVRCVTLHFGAHAVVFDLDDGELSGADRTAVLTEAKRHFPDVIEQFETEREKRMEWMDED